MPKFLDDLLFKNSEYVIAYGGCDIPANAPRFACRAEARKALERHEAHGHFLGASVLRVEAQPKWQPVPARRTERASEPDLVRADSQ